MSKLLGNLQRKVTQTRDSFANNLYVEEDVVIEVTGAQLGLWSTTSHVRVTAPGTIKTVTDGIQPYLSRPIKNVRS